LIHKMIQSEASARCSLGAAEKELASIEGVQLKKELNQKLRAFRNVSNALINKIKGCSGLIELDTFVRENEHTNRGAYDREKT